MKEEMLAELERTLPAAFARSEVPKLLGGLISAGRLANLDSEGLGPRKFNVGRKVGYTRSDFLAWLKDRNAGSLSECDNTLSGPTRKES